MGTYKIVAAVRSGYNGGKSIYKPKPNVENITDIIEIDGNTEADIEKLYENPNVIYAEPNYEYEFHRTPNDPLFPNLWGMQRVNAPTAWNFTTGNPNVIVGVLDSGADGNHPDLRANLRIPNSALFRDFRDLTGHGTHVAGTIGAIGNNRIGVVGTNWRVGLGIFKLGNATLSLSNAIEAINFAARTNLPILNNSWGGRANSAILRFAIENYGGLFIASAGNNGTNNDNFPMFPASYNLPNIISVAATNQNNNLANFSNFGIRSVHIAAPGQAILSTDINNRYTNQSGTSMSAPHVSGCAALLLSINPRLSTAQLRNIILSSATRLPSLNGRVENARFLNIANAIRNL